MFNIRYSSLVAIVVLGFSLSGCIQTSHTMLGSKEYPVLTPEEVTIYLSEEDIPGEWEKVAIINASGSTGYTNQQQMYEAVRKRAAQIGANGVLFQEIDEPSAGAKVAGAFLGTGTNRQVEMVAIYVVE